MGSIIKRPWLMIMGLMLALVVAALMFHFSDPKLMLVAESAVPIYAGVDEALASPPVGIIAELQPRQQVKVIRCVDVKHYLIYKVRLSDGQIGFVNDGKYTLLRDGKPSFC
ncbi:MAG: hypothetical protein KZQ95_22185 [Candidatus Thiodiazotropha sp. (ex Epidulcina cf. delphinae)]|nr:hypothetical protein [Candidatus Thiodiazotropha sp. (ex Epidulcina cf. delphinae)]